MQRSGFTIFLQDRRGAATTLIALSMATLTGAAALSVDLGSAYLAKRQLQGLADSAVLSAAHGDIANDGTSAANAIIARSGISGVTLDELVSGQYRRDATLAVDGRFVAAAPEPTAAKLTLEREVPLFFGKFVFGKPTLTVRATATAARLDMAAFSIGTRLLSLSGGLPNDLLSALAGTNLQLSAVDAQNLVAADMDILGFGDALRVRVGMDDASYAELFDTPVSLRTIVLALAGAAPNTGARDALIKAAAHVGTDTIRLADLIDLGPMGEANANMSGTSIVIDAFSLLRSVLEVSHDNGHEIGLNLTVPGLAGVRLTVLGSGGVARSPWLTVTDSKDVVVRTAQTRIYLEINVGTPIPGLATLHLPVYAELAAGEARLSDISCGGNAMSDGVTLAVTPSLGSASIADLDTAQLDDFSKPMTLQPALLGQILGTKVRASSGLTLGGMQPQQVHFSKSDIASQVTKTVSTNDLVGGIASSLMQNVQVSVTTLGVTIHGGPLVSAVGSQLGLLASPVDALLNQITALLGVKLGSADVRVDKMRCGVPMLVA